MKKSFLYLLSVLLSTFFILNPALGAEVFTLDPQHTYVLWRINHLGFSTQAGKWYATGTLTLDENNPANSKVRVEIKLADIITGIPELDKHLKGDMFFNVKKFPTAIFTSNKVEIIDKSTAKIEGVLKLHGVEKPVILNAKLNTVGENPMSHKKTVGFSAAAQIKRSDFGINSFLPKLGDDVTLNIEVEAHK